MDGITWKCEPILTKMEASTAPPKSTLPRMEAKDQSIDNPNSKKKELTIRRSLSAGPSPRYFKRKSFKDLLFQSSSPHHHHRSLLSSALSCTSTISEQSCSPYSAKSCTPNLSPHRSPLVRSLNSESSVCPSSVHLDFSRSYSESPKRSPTLSQHFESLNADAHSSGTLQDPLLQLECSTEVNQQKLLLPSAYDIENVPEERENEQNQFEKEEEETEKNFQIQVLRDQLRLAAQLGQQVLDKNAELEAKMKEVTQESETAWKRVDELSAQLKKSRRETLEAHQNPVPPIQKEWDEEACLRQEETLLQEIAELRVLLEAEQRKTAKLKNELVEARLEVNASDSLLCSRRPTEGDLNSDSIDALCQSPQSSSSEILDQAQMTITEKRAIQSKEEEVEFLRYELQKCENERFQEKKRATEEIEKYRGVCLEHEILIKSLKKALQSTNTQLRTLSSLSPSTKPPFWESPVETPAGNGIPLHPDAYYNLADYYDSKNSPTIQKKTYPRRNEMLPPQTPKSKVFGSNAFSVLPVSKKHDLGFSSCGSLGFGDGNFELELSASHAAQNGNNMTLKRTSRESSYGAVGIGNSDYHAPLSLDSTQPGPKTSLNKGECHTNPVITSAQKKGVDALPFKTQTQTSVESSHNLLEHYYGRMISSDDHTHDCLTEVLYQQHEKSYAYR